MKKYYPRSSEILLEIAHDKDLKGTLTYQYILQRLGQRAFGIVLLFLSLPSALPFSAIPGVSFIFSLPIAIFSLQLIFARKTLWLPKIIAERTIQHEKVAKLIYAAIPFLQKVERFLKPRWAFMTFRVMEIVNGIIILGLSLLLMLPIPFSNFIIAMLIIILSLGLVEKDGLFIVISYLGTIIYVTSIYWVIFAAIKLF